MDSKYIKSRLGVYSIFLLWGAIFGTVGQFPLVLSRTPTLGAIAWLLSIILSVSVCAIVFGLLLKASRVLHGIGFLVIGTLMPWLFVWSVNWLRHGHPLVGGSSPEFGFEAIFWSCGYAIPFSAISAGFYLVICDKFEDRQHTREKGQ